MRAVIVSFRLRTGQHGRLHCLARSTCDGVLIALDLFGPELRSASARLS
jgi:hypothetical protein